MGFGSCGSGEWLFEFFVRVVVGFLKRVLS